MNTTVLKSILTLVACSGLLAGLGRVRAAECVAITCPKDIVTGCQGAKGAEVTFAPDAGTTCGTTLNVACLPPSGSVFPIGTNLVQCVVSDPRGNMDRCGFYVIVTNTPPSIVCPVPLTINAGADCKAILPLLPITVLERCTPSNQLVFAQSPPAGAVLSVGDHLVTITVLEILCAGRHQRVLRGESDRLLRPAGEDHVRTAERKFLPGGRHAGQMHGNGRRRQFQPVRFSGQRDRGQPVHGVRGREEG